MTTTPVFTIFQLFEQMLNFISVNDLICRNKLSLTAGLKHTSLRHQSRCKIILHFYTGIHTTLHNPALDLAFLNIELLNNNNNGIRRYHCAYTRTNFTRQM